MANQIDERVKPFEVKMGKSIASLDSEFVSDGEWFSS